MDFVIDNYVLLIMLIGMFILTAFDVFLEQKMIERLRLALVMLFVLVVYDSLEAMTGELDHPTMWRILFSAIGYSIRPMIVMMLIFIIGRKIHWAITIPAVLNVITAFSAFFTDVSYSFTPDNVFKRGPLGIIPYATSLFYILALLLVSFNVLAKRSVEEGIIVMFLAAAAGIAALLAAFDMDSTQNKIL